MNNNNNNQNRNNQNCDNCNDQFNVEFGSYSSIPGMSQDAKAGTQDARNKYRGQASQMNNQYSQEFGTGFNAMSSDAKARTQAAAQKYNGQAQNKAQYSTEFAQGTGFAQKGYNALGQEAKQGTAAAKNAYKNEFGTGTNLNPDSNARSQEAAKQMKNYTPNKQNK